MPHGAPEIAAYSILTLLSIALIVHWARRRYKPVSIAEPLRTEAPDNLTFFDRVQRSFHWVTTAVLIMVIITGFALYDPFTFEPIADTLGLPLHSAFPSWVQVHVIFSATLAIFLAVHIVWDTKKLRSFRPMWPSVQDIHDAFVRAKSFFSTRSDYPRVPKYDAFMKLFHIYLIVAFGVLAFTGLYQYFYAPWWSTIWFLHYQVEPAWRPTVIHDLFGFTLIALVVGHVYFATLRVNRPLFRAMIRGKISKAEVNRRYRPDEL
ncbi:MAG: cytochrome b/b6 domain-containing protein [Nitrososphaerales archaeon]|nr:cytochrome b/b6 domain-containing protein [Nitrososphaerales archaeon]